MSIDSQPRPDLSKDLVPPAGPQRCDATTDTLPLDAEDGAYLADLQWMDDQCECGTWEPYIGNYIAVAGKQLIAFGPDSPELRARAARESGLDPDRIAITFIAPAPDE